MLKKNEQGVYRFELFSQFPEVLHGFSSVQFGDMRPSHNASQQSLQTFLHALHIEPKKLVVMNQVHSSNVAWVDISDGGLTVQQTDSLLTKKANLFLGVYIADCVPILLFDPQKKFIGIIHAGWRGLYNEIISNALSEFITSGSQAKDIIAGIGPCIRSCCYTITKEREEMFAQKFANEAENPYIIVQQNATIMDLPLLASRQLLKAGITTDNIEDGGICTKDSPDFYSYRKEGEDFGEFIGIIGRI